MRKQQLDAVEIAQKQRHLYLLGRVKNNQPLTKAELDELNQFEEMAKKSKKTKKKKETPAIADQEIIKNQKEAAVYVDVSQRTIRRWVKAGMPRTKEGYYIKSMLVFYKNNEGREPSEVKKREQTAQADVKEIKAKLLELELKVKQGQLISREDVERETIAKILAVKRALLGLGRKIAGTFTEKSRRKIKTAIDKEVREIIDTFAKG